MKKRLYLMLFAAMSVMTITASCSKETIEGSYSRDDSVLVEEKDTTAPDTPHGENTGPGADIGSGDGMVNDPTIDGWGDGDTSDIIVS